MPPSLVLAEEKYLRWSRPLSCCSITWTTVLCTVSAEAPGYVTLIEINGGAIAGYCAIGSERMERPPANMMTIAITQAKIGRSMKKLTISALQRQGLHVRHAPRATRPGAPPRRV